MSHVGQAIIGRYSPAHSDFLRWAVDWMYFTNGHHAWTSPRRHLATQLIFIRFWYGASEAVEYRNYLIWLGVYPGR